ncbi:major facilitator superfamily domain-containing protein [Mycena crocata]|nr:major facilitator superfamily domain-containing protein [Mycena crocata]
MDPTVFLSDIQILPGNTYEIRTDGLHQVLSRDFADKEVGKEAETEVLPTASESLASYSDDFPDGGFRAWVIVFATFCTYFVSFGYMSCWGVFQAYDQETVLPRSTTSEISWIGSSQHCLIAIPGVIVGPLFDAGYFRIPFTIGSVLIVLGTFLVPFCKVFWHFLLCQGVAIGAVLAATNCHLAQLGFGLVFPISVAIVTQWWNKRRGIAIGVAASGGAFGGFAQCLSRRLPADSKIKTRFFTLSVYRNLPFSLYCAACFVQVLGANGYISISAISVGMSRGFAFYLVAIINASSGMGRIFFGYVGDRLGALNVIISVMFIDLAATLAWPFCRTAASLTAISVIYGFSLGAFGALGLVAIAAMGGTEDVGARLGGMATVIGVGGLCGLPLGGLLKETRLGYEAVGYFGGATIVVSTGFLVATRLAKEPNLRINAVHLTLFGKIIPIRGTRSGHVVLSTRSGHVVLSTRRVRKKL